MTIRGKNHIIGDIGETKTLLLLREWGWAAEKIHPDYGEDIEGTVYIDYRKTKFYFRCQVKSTEDIQVKKYIRRLKDGNYSVRIAADTAKSWFSSYFPVFLVVYDYEEDELFWANPSEQLLTRSKNISGKHINIRVGNAYKLKENREQFYEQINNYYKQLLKITEGVLQCTIFPLLMPGYRLLTIFEMNRIGYGNSDIGNTKVYPTCLPADRLPAWTTIWKSREVNYMLGGYSLSNDVDGLEMFNKTIQEFMKKVLPENIGKNQWICFVISPITWKTKESSGKDIFGKWEVTDWVSYSKPGDFLVNDFLYTFKVSDKWKRECARRCRSWGHQYYVDPDTDLAVEVFGCSETTPAIRRTEQALINHTLGQILAWRCPRNKQEDLNRKLMPLGLCFSPINIEIKSDFVEGFIKNPLLSLETGLFPTANSWEEYEHGAVKEKIAAAGLSGKLEGEAGSIEIQQKMEQIIRKKLSNSHEYTNLISSDYIDGLPMLHNERDIFVYRFRTILGKLDEAVFLQIDDLKEKMRPDNGIETFTEVIETNVESMTCLIAVKWIPDLNESVEDSLERWKPAIIEVFDRMFPRISGHQGYDDTMTVLTYSGEVVFETDD